MNRLVLIDGNAILHRAYHAIPPMRAPDGTPVNAVYGFASMLVKLLHDLRPSHIAVAFDRPAPTFRKQLYGEYQGTRPEMEADLSIQISIVHDMAKAFSVSVYELDGYEADDILGTISTQAATHGIEQVVIVTGDRDILQLVDDERILVFMPVKGLSEAKLYDSKAVVERLGVTPKQLIDYKALAGDASDNYPGVPGVGPKTAVDLVHKYETVEGIYAALMSGNTDLKESIKTKLTQGKESAFLSKTLATIKKDVPIDIDWHRLVFTTLATPDGVDMLSKLQFHSLLKRVQLSYANDVPKAAGEKKRNQKKESDDSGNTQLSLV